MQQPHYGIAKSPYLAVYIKKTRIKAISGIKRDKDIAYLELLMKADELPIAEELKKTDSKKPSKQWEMATH